MNQENKEKEIKSKKKEVETNIYQKLQLIQSEIEELVRTEENKFQKYKYFNELQVLNLLKPLFDKHRLLLLLSDSHEKFQYKKEGNNYEVNYLKHAIFSDPDSKNSEKEKSLVFNF